MLHPTGTYTASRGIKPLSSVLSQALELRLNLTGSVGPNMVIPDQPGQGSWKELKGINSRKAIILGRGLKLVLFPPEVQCLNTKLTLQRAVILCGSHPGELGLG